MKKPEYIIYTDGGCQINPGGAGGYGVVITDCKTGKITELHGAFRSTTNNRMEMMAVLKAAEWIPKGTYAELHMDSQYVMRTLTGEYRKKKNLDLWERISEAMRGKQFTYEWVRGHTGDSMNERCDQLAASSYTNGPWENDKGYSGANRNTPAKRISEISNNMSHENAMAVKLSIPEKFSNKCEYTGDQRYADTHHVNIMCAKAIAEFEKEKPKSFKSYLKLKTYGLDMWSALRPDTMTEFKKDAMDAFDEANKYLDVAGSISAVRWYARGLSLEDAVRKELITKEFAFKR